MGNTRHGIEAVAAIGRLELTSRSSTTFRCVRLAVLLAGCSLLHAARAQQPTEPVGPSPINGETYYFLNQLSAMQMDLNAGSTTAGDVIVQDSGSFTSLSQRWAMTRAPSGRWKISNLLNGLCLDSATVSGALATVQNPCGVDVATQEWTFAYTSNGYNTIVNAGSGDALDISGPSASAGAHLNQSPLSGTPTQSQQWLLRPVFYRGNDNALQEKEEAERVAGPLPWWQDAGTPQDLLQLMKDHGFNLVRIRPTSVPPYQTYTLGASAAEPATCSGYGCYAETDAADLDLARRAKQLGMSVELSLFFDGGSSTASPGTWSGYTVAQTQTAIYNYVETEVEAYRSAGVMPDVVAIGNEVDTGFLASLGGSPSGAANSSAFLNFAAYETSAMQAVTDAAADTSLGPAIPPPVRCIHITPAWDLTSFFSEVNADSVPYDAICQSYYPIYHGPLTAAQAAASNPGNQPVEQTALTNAANSIGKPIFVIETGEHYENGYEANDPWYPATRAGQRQFVLDLESVLKGLPNHLAMGMDYWDAAGTGIGSTAGDGKPDGTFVWNGLTLFDNADVAGSPAGTYNAVLPALSAVGGRLDPSLAYKLVNAADGRILETAAASTASGASLDTALDNGITSQHQEWQIAGNNDGYFQIANLNPATPANVLDTNGLTTPGSAVVQVSAASGTPSQGWDVVSAGNGYFTLVNQLSGLVLGTAAGTGAADAIQQQAPTSTNIDWITPAGKNQMWQIVAVHIVAASTPTALAFDPATVTGIGSGSSPGTVNVDIENSADALIGSPAESVTLTITGPGGFSQSATATSSNGIAGFDLSSIVLTTPGTYTLAATSASLTGATASFTVATSTTTATATVLAAPSSSIFGASVILTATVTGTGGTPAPTETVTFKDGSATLGTGNLNTSSGVATYSTAALAVGTHSLTATYGGDTYNASSVSNTIDLTVTAAPAFAISLAPSSATVANGSSATSTVSVTPSNGFDAAAALTCSGLPAYASCTFSPASVMPNGTAATSTLTIATDVQTASLERPAPPHGSGLPPWLGPVGSGAIFALLFWPTAIARRRSNLRLRTVGFLFLLVLMTHSILGCGGSSNNSSTPLSPTTPSGQYPITITAASGALTDSAIFQLTVQ